MLEDWSSGLGCAAAPDDEQRWRADVETARKRLNRVLQDPTVTEALYLASPSLFERIRAWQQNPDLPSVAGVEETVVKYLTRMAWRCTPFGLFAGTSVGKVDRETELRLPARDQIKRHTRLDMELLDAIIQGLVADPAICEGLTFTANTSIYEVGGTLHYAEGRKINGNRRYFLMDLDPHEPLRRGLLCAQQPRTLEAIAAAIATDEVPMDVARQFTDQLVDAQLLVPTLGPAITGEDALEQVLDALANNVAAEPARAVLEAIHKDLQALDRAGAGNEPENYEQVAKKASQLAPVDPSHLVQVDLVKPGGQVHIAARVVRELGRAAHVLVDLFGYGFKDPLDDFRQAFERRYEERTMPLAEVLDDEIGIGFQKAGGPAADPSPLLAGLQFPGQEEAEQMSWGSRGRFLLWKVSQAIATGAEELVLDPAELEKFHTDDVPELPDAFHIMATLLDHDPENREAAWAFLDSVAGPSGARLLGRFCHADPELEAAVKDHLRQEEALDDTVRYFEVVHLPEGRTGNILARPVLRDLELEFLGQSGAPRDQVLRLDDLTVTVTRGRVVLRSTRLDCEVRPRITSAHNTRHRSLPLYRFLSALQSEGRLEGVLWNWGPLESQPRLPRVRLGHIVLARAQWQVPAPEIRELQSTGHDAFRKVQAWRKTRGLPRWVGLVDQDNVLAVDLDHPLSVASFVDTIKGRDQALLQELFSGGRPDCVEGPDGRYTNEVLIPCLRRADRAARPKQAVQPSSGAGDLFVPGSEWMTVKLYAGEAMCDRVLVELVQPLTRQLRERGVTDQWFFLRFADPDPHLRIRWHGDPAGLASTLIPELHAATRPWLELRILHRIQIDSYQRESRRYGGQQAIALAENLFCADSEFVTDFLATQLDDAGLDQRWRMALVGMDRMIDDAQLTLEHRKDLLDRIATMFAMEFRIDQGLRAGLRERYREEREAIETALHGTYKDFGDGYDLLARRSEQSKDAFARLRALDAQGDLLTPMEEIVGSLLHMHVNRMLRSAQRAQEMVLYRFLEKSYSSRLARERKARS